MLERMLSNWNFHALFMEVQNRTKMKSCVTVFFFGNILGINFLLAIHKDSQSINRRTYI